MIIVRYADDFVIGFQYHEEAETFLADLEQRLSSYELTLHPKKTRLIEFGRHAAGNRKRKGKSKPEVFDFLGFTHMCSTNRKGYFSAKKDNKKTIQKETRSSKRRIEKENARETNCNGKMACRSDNGTRKLLWSTGKYVRSERILQTMYEALAPHT